MSRRTWEKSRGSRGCCGPEGSEDREEWPGAEGLRWVLFALLLYLGVRGVQVVTPMLRELSWLLWLAFAVWWIPVAMDLSRRLLRGGGREWVLGRGLVRVRRISSGKPLPPRRCPHCGERVEAEQAVCPHCYRDLKANCERCGRIFDLRGAAAESLCPECRRERRARQPAA